MANSVIKSPLPHLTGSVSWLRPTWTMVKSKICPKFYSKCPNLWRHWPLCKTERLHHFRSRALSVPISSSCDEKCLVFLRQLEYSTFGPPRPDAVMTVFFHLFFIPRSFPQRWSTYFTFAGNRRLLGKCCLPHFATRPSVWDMQLRVGIIILSLHSWVLLLSP